MLGSRFPLLTCSGLPVDHQVLMTIGFSSPAGFPLTVPSPKSSCPRIGEGMPGFLLPPLSSNPHARPRRRFSTHIGFPPTAAILQPPASQRWGVFHPKIGSQSPHALPSVTGPQRRTHHLGLRDIPFICQPAPGTGRHATIWQPEALPGCRLGRCCKANPRVPHGPSGHTRRRGASPRPSLKHLCHQHGCPPHAIASAIGQARLGFAPALGTHFIRPGSAIAMYLAGMPVFASDVGPATHFYATHVDKLPSSAPGSPPA